MVVNGQKCRNEIIEHSIRAMAEAGASADEIAAAMKTALGATVRSPEIAEELTKAMAKSMALAGASGAEIAAAMKVGLFYICVKCAQMCSSFAFAFVLGDFKLQCQLSCQVHFLPRIGIKFFCLINRALQILCLLTFVVGYQLNLWCKI